MTRLEWGQGQLQFDQGVDQGVLYLDDGAGVPWNGLVSVYERGSESVDTEYYFDGNRILVAQQISTFSAHVTAFTYPDAFADYNGYSEKPPRGRFGMSYRTHHDDGARIHLIYNAAVSDDDKVRQSMSDTPDPSLFGWDFSSSAVPMSGARAGSHMIMKVDEGTLLQQTLEDILYGSETTHARMPSAEEMIDIYESLTILRITYNQDGTYTATGPDDMIQPLAGGRFRLTSPSLYLLDTGVFTVSSY